VRGRVRHATAPRASHGGFRDAFGVPRPRFDACEDARVHHAVRQTSSTSTSESALARKERDDTDRVRYVLDHHDRADILVLPKLVIRPRRDSRTRTKSHNSVICPRHDCVHLSASLVSSRHCISAGLSHHCCSLILLPNSEKNTQRTGT
jgi:hypothetical protein